MDDGHATGHQVRHSWISNSDDIGQPRPHSFQLSRTSPLGVSYSGANNWSLIAIAVTEQATRRSTRVIRTIMTLFGTTTPGRYCGQTQAATLRGRGQTTLCHQSMDRPFGTLQLGHATWQAQEDPRSTANGHHLYVDSGQPPGSALVSPISHGQLVYGLSHGSCSSVTPIIWSLLLSFITKWGQQN